MAKPKKKKKDTSIIKIIVWITIFYVVIGLLALAKEHSGFFIFLSLVAIALILYYVFVLIYCSAYFKGKKFHALKDSISEYIEDCNELNQHIEDLRSSYVDVKKTDYGEASYSNVGNHNYKRKGIANAKYAPNVYDCSRQVCDSARKQPFKYICKYFNIKENEKSLEQFEEILNNFSAAEEGEELSRNKRKEILASIKKDVPGVVRTYFSNKLERELGFDEFEFDELFFPVFSFRYISSGGNSGSQFDVTMDIPMLERFINYLSERVKFRVSAEGQRRLMTPKLRRFIIDRDDNTCKNCGNSTYNEPNLLMEVDHIIPIAKGGMTTEENLQTLCWKCNRRKGAKIA